MLILKQTEMTTLFGNNKCLVNILTMAKEEETFLKTLICFDKPEPKLIELTEELNITLYSYSYMMDQYLVDNNNEINMIPYE